MEFYKKILLSSILICAVLMVIMSLFVMSFSPIFTGTVDDHMGNTLSINDTSKGGISGIIANASGGDVILLDSGNYTGTNNTGITINKSITLKGNGPTDTVIIDGKSLTRIFEVENNLRVTFTNITFINADATDNGGAISNPNNNTRIKFINCTFTNNKITNTTATDGFGGAIYNTGVVNLVSCNFTDISAAGSGGAIYNDGLVMGLVDCVFTNISVAVSGGIIFGDGLVMGLVNSNFNNITVNNSTATNSTATNNEVNLSF